jgi:hypothetical protein
MKKGTKTGIVGLLAAALRVLPGCDENTAEGFCEVYDKERTA